MIYRRKRNQFTLAWYDEDFPLVSQEYSKWVKRKNTRQQGVFRGLILAKAEEGLRNESPIKTPLERVEAKLDELLKLVKHGVPLSQAMQASESQEVPSIEGELSPKDKARLNKLLDL